MKKNIIIFICAIVLVFSMMTFVACNQDSESDVYSVLNSLLDKEYDSLVLEVETSQTMGTLTNTYTISKVDNGTKVQYECESFAQFSGNSVPSNMIETKTGYKVFADGVAVESSGDAVSVSLPQSSVIDVEIVESNLTNVQTQDGSFSASVVNPAQLIAGTEGCVDMTVTINYTSDAIVSVVISYTTATNMGVVATYSIQ